MLSDFNAWYTKQQLFTRVYVTVLLIFGLISKFKPSFIMQILFLPHKLFSLQLHRLVTHFFFQGSISFSLILHLFFVIFCVRNCELMFEGANYADFYYMILYLMTLGNIAAWVFEYSFLSYGFCFALVYIWCKRKPFETVRFYFGLQIKSEYFPWVLIAFHLLIDQDFYQDLIGLGLGQSYLVLKDFLPVTHSITILETPRFFKNFINRWVTPHAPFARNRFNQQNFERPPQDQPFFFGRGMRLG